MPAGRYQLDFLGAGLPGTNTYSTKQALEILLGRPCYHMSEAMTNGDAGAWAYLVQEGWHGGRAGVQDALSYYTATVGWPSAMCWEDLLDTYPDAQVLLTIRDFEQWWTNLYNTAYQVYLQLAAVPAYILLTNPKVKHLKVIQDALFGAEGLFKGRFADKDFVRKVFDAHHAHVRKTVPADRLLEFNVKEGWEPLCKFVGAPVPDQDFPSPDASDEFAGKSIAGMELVSTFDKYWAPALVAAAVGGGATYAAIRLLGNARD